MTTFKGTNPNRKVDGFPKMDSSGNQHLMFRLYERKTLLDGTTKWHLDSTKSITTEEAAQAWVNEG